MHGDRSDPPPGVEVAEQALRPTRSSRGSRAPRDVRRWTRLSAGPASRKPLRAGGGVDHDRQATRRRSTARAARPSALTIAAWASVKPLELNGVPQQVPATSGGIQTGSPARRETATSASGRLAQPAAIARAGGAEDAIDAGRQVDGGGAGPLRRAAAAAPRRAASARPSRERSSAPSSRRARSLARPTAALAEPRGQRRPGPRPARAPRSTSSQRPASALGGPLGCRASGRVRAGP